MESCGIDVGEYCRELNDIITDRRPMIERYFVRRYKFDAREHMQEDLCILEHSNRICVVTLANCHPIVCEKKRITKIKFLFDLKTGRQYVSENSRLCNITCEDGCVYGVSSPIRAQLIELNDRLLSEPQLLTDKPSTEGFVAMLLPKKQEQSSEMQKLTSSDAYQQLLIEKQKDSIDS